MKELSDNDILNYLMTSEFNEGLKPEELKFLLIKFRIFYRNKESNLSRVKYEYQAQDLKLKEEIERLKKENFDLSKELSIQSNLYKNLLNRKLSLKERFSGKLSK